MDLIIDNIDDVVQNIAEEVRVAGLGPYRTKLLQFGLHIILDYYQNKENNPEIKRF